MVLCADRHVVGSEVEGGDRVGEVGEDFEGGRKVIERWGEMGCGWVMEGLCEEGSREVLCFEGV